MTENKIKATSADVSADFSLSENIGGKHNAK